jgi:hypothetical protein
MAESFGIILLIFAIISVTGLLLLRRLSNLDSRALAEEFAVLTGFGLLPMYCLSFRALLCFLCLSMLCG